MSNQNSDPITEQIKAELHRIRDEATKPLEGMRARLQDLEQKVVAGGHDWGADSPGPLDLSPLLEHESFQRLQAGGSHQTENIALVAGIRQINASLYTDTGEADTAHGTMPSRPDQIGGYHGYVLRPLRLVDLLPSIRQGTNSFDYVRLTFTGDAEVQDGEGAEKAEADFEGTLVDGKVATIAVHTTASAQVLDDSQQLAATINNILTHKVLAALETQLITGSGTGQNIEGIYTAAAAITTLQNEVPDRIGFALTQMETAGYVPNAILMNPNDWFNISTMKDSQGRYLYGDPANPAPPTLWNRPVIASSSIPAGTALIGDTLKAQIRDRMRPTIFISRDHKDYRTRNLVLILVELRAGLAIFDESAFRKVDLAAAT